MTYLSTKLRTCLENINTRIKDNLVTAANDKIDYIDFKITDERLMLTFANPINVSKCDCHKGNVFNCKLRQDKKPVSLLQTLLPLEDKAVLEDVVTKLSVEASGIAESIKVASGDAIQWVYNKKNYYTQSSETLFTSCMSDPGRNFLMEFYAKNPQAVKIVYTTTNEQVTARALVWNGKTEDGREVSVLDRVYYNNSSQKEVIYQWGMENCDYIKQHPDTHFLNTKTDSKEYIKIEIPIVWRFDGDVAKYPYLDTFGVLNVESNILTNVNEGKESHFVLRDGYGNPVSLRKRFNVTDTLVGLGFVGSSLFPRDKVRATSRDGYSLTDPSESVDCDKCGKQSAIRNYKYIQRSDSTFITLCYDCAERNKDYCVVHSMMREDNLVCKLCSEAGIDQTAVGRCYECSAVIMSADTYDNNGDGTFLCATCCHSEEEYCEWCEEYSDFMYDDYLCQYCADRTSVCDSCGERQWDDNIYGQNGSYCGTCYSNYFVTCFQCDCETDRDWAYFEDDEYFCRQCYDEVFAVCGACGKVLYKDMEHRFRDSDDYAHIECIACMNCETILDEECVCEEEVEE